MRESTNLRYIRQDHLSGTALVTSDNGTQLGTIKYYPYGDCRNSQGTLGTDKLFTGQRLDDTGLYYYGARYYDPTIGRFISADTLVQSFKNPQTFNRCSYVLNNPLKYVDPSGLDVHIGGTDVSDLEDIVDEIIEYEEWGVEPPPDLIEELLELIEGWGEGKFDIWNEWERLEREELEYAQHMEDSDITFNIIDIDLLYKTVSFRDDLPDIGFKDPMKLMLVSNGPFYGPTYPTYDLMNRLDARGLSLFPGIISIRTDITRTTKEFTWDVAHELYHQFEQSVFGAPAWYVNYLLESRRSHALRTSEIRAKTYANRYYPD